MRLIMSDELFIFLIISTLGSFLSAFELQCQIEQKESHFLPGPSCIVQNLTILCKDRVSAISILNRHYIIQSNKVKIIEFKNQDIRFFPSGMERFFKNLEAISMINSPLNEIKKNDIEVFRKLKKLLVENCELETLDSNLFDSNKKLRLISFKGNKLKVIGDKIFVSLKQLNFLDLRNNHCIDRELKSAVDVLELMNEIKYMCPTFENIMEIVRENQKLETMLQIEIMQSKSFEKSKTDLANSDNELDEISIKGKFK